MFLDKRYVSPKNDNSRDELFKFNQLILPKNSNFDKIKIMKILS